MESKWMAERAGAAGGRTTRGRRSCLPLKATTAAPGEAAAGAAHLLLLCLPLRTRGPQSARLFCPWGFPGKNTRVGCHILRQRIFPTHGLNPHLLHCRWILYYWAMGKSLPLRVAAAQTCLHWSSLILCSPTHFYFCCQRPKKKKKKKVKKLNKKRDIFLDRFHSTENFVFKIEIEEVFFF